MSSTNRGGRRSPADFYPTPEWCVRRLLEKLELPGGRWLEPAAGDGAIVRAVQRRDVAWDLWEIRTEQREVLESAAPGANVMMGDFLEATRLRSAGPEPYVVAITNPPFSMAQEFIEACMSCSELTIMLLRLNFLSSRTRYGFMSVHTPDVYVLPSRPSFTGRGTDSIEYAWFVWRREPRSAGKVTVLGLKDR